VTDAGSDGGVSVAALAATWSTFRAEIPAWDLNLALLSATDSTQRVARTLLDQFLREDEEPFPFVVAALRQSAGRGRQGREWWSPPGGGIYVSLVLPTSGPEELATVPLRAAVSLAEFLGSLLAGGCRIKWPNDLVVERRKIGGLLVDAVFASDAPGRSWAVLGFGLNLKPSTATGRPPGSTSLAEEMGGETPSLAEFAAQALAAVWRGFALSREETVARFARLSAHRDGEALRCRVGDEELDGFFRGFDERGFLRLETERGERIVRSGEVFAW